MIYWVRRGWLKSLDFLTFARFNNELRHRDVQPLPVPFQSGWNVKGTSSFKTTLEALLKRASKRSFGSISMSQAELLDCLSVFHAGIPFDSIKNADSLFLICAIFSVDGNTPGIYRFNSRNDLTLVRDGDFRQEISTCIAGMAAPLTANLSVFICVDFESFLVDLDIGSMALRKLYYYAGICAQRILVKGSALGIQGVPTPALADARLSRVFEFQESACLPIYSITLGKI